MYLPEWQTVYALTRGLFWCLFPELCSNEGNKHKINTRVSALTVCHESAFIILFLTQHNEPINNHKSNDLHTPTPWLICLVYVLLIRHNRVLMTSQWPDNCDAIIWKVISNLLNIDFIHDDIHSQSCKKVDYLNGWGMSLTYIKGIKNKLWFITTRNSRLAHCL